MSDLINVSKDYLDKNFFDDSCQLLVAEETLSAIRSGSLKLLIKKIGRSKVKVCRLNIILRNISGAIFINVSSGDSEVEIEKNVHGKFDLKLYSKSQVFIGAGTTSGSTAIFCKNSSFFCGADCMFSTNVTIQSSDQHGIVDLKKGTIVNNTFSKVELGDHVWLGRSVSLTSNAAIGDGSLIAIGSVVTKRLPKNVIAGGVPAKILKYDHTWCRSPDKLDNYSLSLSSKF